MQKKYKKNADPCPRASNFSGNIYADVESSPIENTISYINFVIAKGKNFFIKI
tara:strand:+ start:1902 stop:2060 length:159 start_codon:yes stop_codon:yes gene_type:complete